MEPAGGLEENASNILGRQWFNLADEVYEDALYDVPAFREGLYQYVRVQESSIDRC